MGNQCGMLCPVNYLDDQDFESKWVISEKLGAGKFSEVFLVYRKDNPSKKFALKCIQADPNDMMGLNMIRDEIAIMQALGEHPGIMQLIDVDESNPDMIRLVLELCEGGELYDKVQQQGVYPEHEAKLIMRSVLNAVAYIHSRGIMHRDLKPENILLVSKNSSTDVKISDFGLAKISKDYPRRLPRSHSICGSDFYLAPEVIKQEEYGREIDIWACGVVAYVLMSGSLPFFHNVLHKLYRQIVERDLTFPEQSWRHVSKGAQDFVLRLLQTRPGDRLSAEQALNHPWLRGSQSPMDSFGGHPSGMPPPGTPGAGPNPLAHPHPVHAPVGGAPMLAPHGKGFDGGKGKGFDMGKGMGKGMW